MGKIDEQLVQLIARIGIENGEAVTSSRTISSKT